MKGSQHFVSDSWYSWCKAFVTTCIRTWVASTLRSRVRAFFRTRARLYTTTFRKWNMVEERSVLSTFIAVSFSSSSSSCMYEQLYNNLLSMSYWPSHGFMNWLHKSASWIGFLMALGRAYIRMYVSICSQLASCEMCVVRDRSLWHWLYKPVAKPHVQLAKFFFAVYVYKLLGDFYQWLYPTICRLIHNVGLIFFALMRKSTAKWPSTSSQNETYLPSLELPRFSTPIMAGSLWMKSFTALSRSGQAKSQLLMAGNVTLNAKKGLVEQGNHITARLHEYKGSDDQPTWTEWLPFIQWKSSGGDSL